MEYVPKAGFCFDFDTQNPYFAYGCSKCNKRLLFTDPPPDVTDLLPAYPDKLAKYQAREVIPGEITEEVKATGSGTASSKRERSPTKNKAGKKTKTRSRSRRRAKRRTEGAVSSGKRGKKASKEAATEAAVPAAEAAVPEQEEEAESPGRAKSGSSQPTEPSTAPPLVQGMFANLDRAFGGDPVLTVEAVPKDPKVLPPVKARPPQEKETAIPPGAPPPDLALGWERKVLSELPDDVAINFLRSPSFGTDLQRPIWYNSQTGQSSPVPVYVGADEEFYKQKHQRRLQQEKKAAKELANKELDTGAEAVPIFEVKLGNPKKRTYWQDYSPEQQEQMRLAYRQDPRPRRFLLKVDQWSYTIDFEKNGTNSRKPDYPGNPHQGIRTHLQKGTAFRKRTTSSSRSKIRTHEGGVAICRREK